MYDADRRVDHGCDPCDYERYEEVSIVLTSNRDRAEWPDLFGEALGGFLHHMENCGAFITSRTCTERTGQLPSQGGQPWEGAMADARDEGGLRHRAIALHRQGVAFGVIRDRLGRTRSWLAKWLRRYR